MSPYRHLLLAVDLSQHSRQVALRAQQLATSFGARLDIIHVVEFVPVEPMGETLMPAVQIEEELLERAQQRLDQLVTDLNLQVEELHVEAGNVKAEILRVAQERKVDLIVLGSRERHGLSIMINLTEDTVLHQSPCDVLAVRVGNSKAQS
ncbi:MAG: universal stress protein [Steroidobacteraceae bacterium]